MAKPRHHGLGEQLSSIQALRQRQTPLLFVSTASAILWSYPGAPISSNAAHAKILTALSTSLTDASAQRQSSSPVEGACLRERSNVFAFTHHTDKQAIFTHRYSF